MIAFPEGRMRKFAGALFVVMLALLAVGAAALFGIYRASQQVPPFYQQAITRSYAAIDSGDRFERQALALHNQARHAGSWEARFTEEEINAWLAGALPQKFPEALASGISDPRVAIEGETVRLAVLYRRGSTSTVVSLAAQVHLTAELNEVAVRVGDVRAGTLPVPLARFLGEITLRAAQAGLPLHWTEAGGKPVALVRLPLDPKAFKGRQLTLERLEFQDRELVVGGRTEESPAAEELAGSADQPDEELASPKSSETRQR